MQGVVGVVWVMQGWGVSCRMGWGVNKFHLSQVRC